MRIRKEAQLADVNRDRRRRRHPFQRGAKIGQTLLRPFADEPRSDVQVGGRAPFDARRGT